MVFFFLVGRDNHELMVTLAATKGINTGKVLLFHFEFEGAILPLALAQGCHGKSWCCLFVASQPPCL